MPINLFNFNWRNSEAHSLLLSKFLRPNSPSNYTNEESWQEVLKENPSKSIKRFVDEGFLVKADLRSRLNFKYTVSELKDILKNKGSKITGNKAVLIEQLILIDPDYAERIAEGIEVYICSSTATPLVNRFLDEKSLEKEKLVGNVIDHINAQFFEKACNLVAAYEAKQVFPREFNNERSIEILTEIFHKMPKRLIGLPAEKIYVIRVAAALKQLIDETTAQKYLPEDFDLGVDMDLQPALNLFWIGAMRTASLENYRRNSDIIVGVRLFCVDDACVECKKLSGTTYKFNEFIPIPDDVCTNKKGCRCTYLPITLLNPFS